jgi:hypothetical protein
MSRLAVRLARLTATVPPPVAPVVYDLTRLTPDQRMRLAHLGDRYQAVGISGLSDDELHEISALVTILDGERYL